MRVRIQTAGAALLAAACATAPEPAPAPPRPDAFLGRAIITDGAYEQEASGMVFPAAVGGFLRVSLTSHRADGSDETAGYNFAGPDAAFVIATVTVYPSPDLSLAESLTEPHARLCDAQFLLEHEALLAGAPGARLVARRTLTLTQDDGARLVGPSAAYLNASERTAAAGEGPAALGSELHLFCYVGGRWTVKYRISYPAAYEARPAIAGFMGALALTIGAQQRDEGLIAGRSPEGASGGAG